MFCSLPLLALYKLTRFHIFLVICLTHVFLDLVTCVPPWSISKPRHELLEELEIEWSVGQFGVGEQGLKWLLNVKQEHGEETISEPSVSAGFIAYDDWVHVLLWWRKTRTEMSSVGANETGKGHIRVWRGKKVLNQDITIQRFESHESFSCKEHTGNQM